MTASKLSAILLGLAIGAACGTQIGCASDLGKLTDKIEHTPIHKYGWTPPDTAELVDVSKRLKWAAGYLGISIQPNPTMEATEYGMYQPETRVIYYNPTLAFDAQVQVIAHELAHPLQPPGLELAERELFADAVSYLVLKPERDQLNNYASYLARYKTHARTFFKLHEAQIWWAVRFLRMEGTR